MLNICVKLLKAEIWPAIVCNGNNIMGIFLPWAFLQSEPERPGINILHIYFC